MKDKAVVRKVAKGKAKPGPNYVVPAPTPASAKKWTKSKCAKHNHDKPERGVNRRGRGKIGTPHTRPPSGQNRAARRASLQAASAQ